MIDVAHSMASANPSSSSSSAAAPATPLGLKNYFKSEGRYELHHEKGHPPGLMNSFQGKTVNQATLAHLKDRLSPPTPPAQPPSFSVASGVRSAAARLLGGSNGGRALSFVGGSDGSKSVSVTTRLGSLGGVTGLGSSTSTLNFDGKVTYLIFNMGDALFISDLNTRDKDPMKAIHFNMYPVCHAFDHDVKVGHDLLIGLSTGDVYSTSLRQQLLDSRKKLTGALHYNKDGSINARVWHFLQTPVQRNIPNKKSSDREKEAVAIRRRAQTPRGPPRRLSRGQGNSRASGAG